MSIWNELGITQTGEAALIRQAYARRLKTLDTETQADAFQKLRHAYEQALAFARQSNTGVDVEQHTPNEAAHTSENLPTAVKETECTDEDEWDEDYSQQISATLNETQGDEAFQMAVTLFQILGKQGEAAALQHFFVLHDSEALLNLDFKQRFEQGLLYALIHAEQVPKKLFRTFCDAFDWLDEKTGLQARYPTYYWHLQPKIATLERHEALLAMADEHLVVAIVTGPYRPLWFKGLTIKHSSDIIVPVQELLEDLETNDPNIFHHLDPRIIRWWREADSSFSTFIIRTLITVAIAATFIFIFTLTGDYRFPAVITFWVIYLLIKFHRECP